jgi:hypothetical protein
MPTTVDLTPSEAMVSAASRGLELATAGTGVAGIEPAAKARARKIAAGEKLTPAQVARIHSSFLRAADQRQPEWGLMGSETPGFVAWQLLGGDAGKAWAAAKIKALAGAGVDMDETETHEVVEMFFGDAMLADGVSVEEDDDGLIWKPMLPVGIWKVGPNGRPLRVVPGKSPDQRQAIGMQDIIESFNANALPHVTIPKTHEDAVDENTGFIRKLRVGTHKGIKTLFGGHGFTDKKIKGKVVEGSIANTSVGLEFDYIRKDDGKKFPIVLRHNALTNRPWLGRRLAPFGVNAEESTDEYLVMCGEYSEQLKEEDLVIDLWDNALTYAEVREALAEQTDGCELIDFATDRVLLKDGDKNFVAKFTIDDGDVKLSERPEWVERKITLEDDHSTSGTTSTIPTSQESPTVETIQTKEATVPEGTKPEETPQGTPPATTPPAPAAKLSEDPDFQAMLAENARIKAENDRLLAKDRERDANEFVSKLKLMGLDEQHGCTDFLKAVRGYMLADSGDTALLLSEDGQGAGSPLTVTEIIGNIFSKLPLGEDGKVKVQLAEQATDPLGQAEATKPPETGLPVAKDGEELSLEDKNKVADAWFEESYPGAAKTTIQTKES